MTWVYGSRFYTISNNILNESNRDKTILNFTNIYIWYSITARIEKRVRDVGVWG